MKKQVNSLAATALVAGALLAGAVAVRAEDKADQGKMGIISATKLVKHPADYYGKTVTVQAKVEDVLGSNMFTLDEDALLAGPDVLVLVPKGVAASVAHDQKVTVTGQVRRYVESELKKDFDWFENGKLVDVKTKVDWKTRPVIVADSVTVAGAPATGGE